MTTRDIQGAIKELYNGADISHSVITNVTDAVIEEVTAWKNSPLEAIYLAMGVTCDGHKDLLRLWISEKRSKVLARRPHRPSATGREGYLYCMRGRPDWLSRRNLSSLSQQGVMGKVLVNFFWNLGWIY